MIAAIRLNRILAVVSIVLLIGLTPGCAGYQYGTAALFPTNIRTVHVPIVRNDTYRHDLGVRLTEALIREIERRSHFKVSSDPNSDSTLRCRIVGETKRVLSESDSDDPRALDAQISVRAAWTNRSGQLLMQNSVVPLDDTAISFGQNARFVPEAGQSIATATQQAIDGLASRIVSQMEIRW